MAEDHSSEAGGSPSLAKNCSVDTVVSALLFIFGAVVVVESRRLGAGWTSDGPGAGYFPFYIGLIICISALGVMVQSRSQSFRRTSPWTRPSGRSGSGSQVSIRPARVRTTIFVATNGTRFQTRAGSPFSLGNVSDLTRSYRPQVAVI